MAVGPMVREDSGVQISAVVVTCPPHVAVSLASSAPLPAGAVRGDAEYHIGISKSNRSRFWVPGRLARLALGSGPIGAGESGGLQVVGHLSAAALLLMERSRYSEECQVGNPFGCWVAAVEVS